MALVRALADIGLTAGLSKALASDRPLVHGRGRALADLACAIAESDYRRPNDTLPGSGRHWHPRPASGERPPVPFWLRP